MQHVKEILSNLISDLDKKRKKEPVRVFEIWNAIAGENIAAHTKPYELKRRILFVMVDDSTWAYELNQRYKEELIKKLNDKLGNEAIRDIRIRIGDID